MSSRASLPHVPALDGLRGAAVLGVVAFHFAHYTGGYLGVDLFFVLSGYLITSLLLVEHQGQGSISLGAFWARRARRLLPAVLLVLAAVAVYARLAAAPTQLAGLRGDGLATLFYVANWRAVASNTSYWAMFSDPSPLQHTWSLAIEEQFYLVWPLVAWIVLRPGRRQPARTMFAVSAVGLVASAAAQLLLYRPGTDPSRVYFGTDTRVAAIFFGAALASFRAWRGLPEHGPGRTAIEVGGWIGLAVLAVHWTFVDGQDAELYRGGLLLCGLAATALLAAAVAPGSPVGRLFSLAPLRAVGLVSYGVYLWHWPVLVVLSPDRTHLDGVALLAARLAVTGAVTMVSYVVLEQPIRRGALRGWAGRLSAPAGIAAASVLLVACTAAPAGTPSSSDTVAAALAGVAPGGDPTAPADPPTTGAGPTSPGPSPTGTGSPATSAPLGAAPPTTTADLPADVIRRATETLGRPPRVLLVGDSVAYSMAAGMVPAEDQLGLDVESGAIIACGVARGTGKVKLPGDVFATESAECHAWPTRWRELLDDFRPDLALLIIGWPGSTEREVGGVYRKPCDPVFDAFYEGEVREALDVLRSTGTHVAMTTVPYYRSTKAPPGNDDNVDCINRQYLRILADVNATAEREGTPDRRVTVVDLAHYVCPAERTCRTEVQGITMRVDGLHYDGPPGVIVGTWVVAQGLAGTGVAPAP